MTCGLGRVASFLFFPSLAVLTSVWRQSLCWQCGSQHLPLNSLQAPVAGGWVGGGSQTVMHCWNWLLACPPPAQILKGNSWTDEYQRIELLGMLTKASHGSLSSWSVEICPRLRCTTLILSNPEHKNLLICWAGILLRLLLSWKMQTHANNPLSYVLMTVKILLILKNMEYVYPRCSNNTELEKHVLFFNSFFLGGWAVIAFCFFHYFHFSLFSLYFTHHYPNLKNGKEPKKYYSTVSKANKPIQANPPPL